MRKKNPYRPVLCVDTLEKAATVELMPFPSTKRMASLRALVTIIRLQTKTRVAV